MAHPIYLDYNGTTPHDPEVIEAMRPYLDVEFGNPSSSHWYGIAPRRAVEKAREQVAALLNCQSEEIIFTSGGTESNNHALRGVAWARRDKGNHLITSVFEHPAILEVCGHLEQSGFEVTYLPVDGEGMVDPGIVEKAIRPNTTLITIMHANNEVGTLQPVSEIAWLAHKNDIVFHSDAAQSVGKVQTDVGEMAVDLLSLAGHKIYAPKGIGALFIKTPHTLQKFCFGAGQERGLRAGTENVPFIVGLGKACEIAGRDLVENQLKMTSLRDRLWHGLLAHVDDIKLNGHQQKRLPNTLNVSFLNLEANRILEEIGLQVAASAGAACHSDIVTISHVLEAMHIPQEWAKGTVRFTVGRMTTEAEIDTAIAVIREAVADLRASKGAGS